MLSVDLKEKLEKEFGNSKTKSNPRITSDIEAVVVLSGESRDPKIKTNLRDTEERLTEGIRIYKKIERVGGIPTLVLTGTDSQNIFMQEESKRRGVKKIVTSKNPPYPKASTKTQFKGLRNLKFKKIAVVTHAYHGPRTKLYIDRNLFGREVLLFLIDRDRITRIDIETEKQKIRMYFPEELKKK